MCWTVLDTHRTVSDTHVTVLEPWIVGLITWAKRACSTLLLLHHRENGGGSTQRRSLNVARASGATCEDGLLCALQERGGHLGKAGLLDLELLLDHRVELLLLSVSAFRALDLGLKYWCVGFRVKG